MKAAIMMLALQCIMAGANILYKLSAAAGMDMKVFTAYRMMFAAASMAPIAFFIERATRPKLTWRVLGHAFLCGLLGGSLSQNLIIEGVALTTPTLAIAMLNLSPVFTFLFAILFRLEKFDIKKMSCKLKSLGTVVGMGGAMVFAFYKGPIVSKWDTHINLISNSPHQSEHSKSFYIGVAVSIAGSMVYALYLIAQARMTKCYPCFYSGTALMCFMGALQATVFALIVDHNWNQWRLGWSIKLLGVAYSGVFAFAGQIIILVICINWKGPLYVSMFNPVVLVILAIVGSLILDEPLTLGSVIGAVLIISALYLVLWGKMREEKENSLDNENPSDSRRKRSDQAINRMEMAPKDNATHEHRPT